MISMFSFFCSIPSIFLNVYTTGLLKSVKNLHNKTVGSFTNVKNLYKNEKENILKSVPLSLATIRPPRLQPQNVKQKHSI